MNMCASQTRRVRTTEFFYVNSGITGGDRRAFGLTYEDLAVRHCGQCFQTINEIFFALTNNQCWIGRQWIGVHGRDED